MPAACLLTPPALACVARIAPAAHHDAVYRIHKHVDHPGQRLPGVWADQLDEHEHGGNPRRWTAPMSVSAGAARALESGGIRDSKFVFHPA
jgi:hypothetical protein